jgi:hypothetical protein
MKFFAGPCATSPSRNAAPSCACSTRRSRAPASAHVHCLKLARGAGPALARPPRHRRRGPPAHDRLPGLPSTFRPDPRPIGVRPSTCPGRVAPSSSCCAPAGSAAPTRPRQILAERVGHAAAAAARRTGRPADLQRQVALAIRGRLTVARSKDPASPLPSARIPCCGGCRGRTRHCTRRPRARGGRPGAARRGQSYGNVLAGLERSPLIQACSAKAPPLSLPHAATMESTNDVVMPTGSHLTSHTNKDPRKSPMTRIPASHRAAARGGGRGRHGHLARPRFRRQARRADG